jgi:hypothetical protein
MADAFPVYERLWQRAQDDGIFVHYDYWPDKSLAGYFNLNVHFHLLVPDGVLVDDDDRLAFALHPVPTSADVLAILDRIVRRIARRLTDEARDDWRWTRATKLACVPPLQR